MKRIVRVTICLLVLMFILPINSLAVSNDKETIVHSFSDGSYLTERIVVVESRATATKTGNKVYTYYDSDGIVVWKVTLSGTFTYTGTSAVCTSASCNVSLSDSTWSYESKSATKSGNTAYGNATMIEKVLGVTVTRVPVSLTLSCDGNGNLS